MYIFLLLFLQVKHVGSTVYSSSRDKTIKAWHADRSDPSLTYEGHRLVVTAIDLNEGKIENQLKTTLWQESPQ